MVSKSQLKVPKHFVRNLTQATSVQHHHQHVHAHSAHSVPLFPPTPPHSTGVVAYHPHSHSHSHAGPSSVSISQAQGSAATGGHHHVMATNVITGNWQPVQLAPIVHQYAGPSVYGRPRGYLPSTGHISSSSSSSAAGPPAPAPAPASASSSSSAGPSHHSRSSSTATPYDPPARAALSSHVGGRSTKDIPGWLLPVVSPAAAGTPDYLALLPSWEYATFSATDALAGRLGELAIATPYISRSSPSAGSAGPAAPHRPAAARDSSSGSHSYVTSPRPVRARRYSTTARRSRASLDSLPSFSTLSGMHSSGTGPPSDVPFVWLQHPIKSWTHIPPSLNPPSSSSSSAASTSGSADIGGGSFFSPPPPPPSPGPIPRPPSQAMNPPRPSESHTVLSPAPLAPTEGGGSSNAGSLSLGASPYLSPLLSELSPPLTPPDDTAPELSAAYASNLVFRFGAFGLPKDRPAISPRASSRRANSPTPPPRPRSFALPDVTAPAAGEFRSTSVGEDAYFARSDGLCVADGVGGWARSGRGGADAGRWSRLLTHFCEREVEAWWAGSEEYVESIAGKEGGDVSAESRGGGGGGGGGGSWADKIWSGAAGAGKRDTAISGRDKDAEGLPDGRRRRKLDPVEVMQRGFEKCLACVLAEGIHGSSTCLVALLHHSSLLIANLGDCCLLLVRNGQIVFRTTEMQHAFNFPLQVGTHSRDEPMKDAKRFEVGVEMADVVVVGSDGLMDNLFDEDILDCLATFAPPSTSPSSPSGASALPTPPASRPSSRGGLPAFSPQKISEALCRRAREVSEEPNATTPFMVRAIEEGIDFVGGKKDDISVIVGVIGSRGDGLELRSR